MSKWKRTRIRNLGGIEAYQKYMTERGRKGGATPTTKLKGFASDPERASRAGSKGGKISSKKRAK